MEWKECGPDDKPSFGVWFLIVIFLAVVPFCVMDGQSKRSQDRLVIVEDTNQVLKEQLRFGKDVHGNCWVWSSRFLATLLQAIDCNKIGR